MPVAVIISRARQATLAKLFQNTVFDQCDFLRRYTVIIKFKSANQRGAFEVERQGIIFDGNTCCNHLSTDGILQGIAEVLCSNELSGNSQIGRHNLRKEFGCALSLKQYGTAI